MSFLEPPLGLDQNNEPIVTGDAEYEQPLRPYIRFQDRLSKATNYIYDGFRSSNPWTLSELDCEMGIGETGLANITIQDCGNVDESLINWGNKVVIKLAKNQWEFTGNTGSTFLIGYVKGYTKDRPDTGILNHKITVYGSKILFSERIINYKKGTESNTNSSFTTRSHIRSILGAIDGTSGTFALPIKGIQPIAQQGTFHNNIHSGFKTMVKKVNFEMVEAANAITRLVDIEGGRWFIDYVGETETLRATFPSDMHTGITVKSGDIKSFNDPAKYTSYFYGPWNSDADITGSTGFANRLYTKTQIDRKEFTSSFVNKNSTTLANKALAQKFYISETRLTDLGLLLSKVGEPTSQNDRINGRIIADKNNKPEGNIISDFKIPLSSIEEEPETIFVNDLDIKNRFVSQELPAWIVLYQRSGTEEANGSEPNTDEANTIRWHHNNDTTTVTTLVSARAKSGDRDDKLVWEYNTSGGTKGPTFGFGVFAEVRHIQELSDKGSIQRYGLVEGEVDTSFLDSPTLIQTYIEAQLQYSSKPRIIFNTNKLKIPSNFLFKPYQIVRLEDTVSYPRGIDAEIQRARYHFNAYEFGLGCRFADITPMAFYDYLLENIRCS